jgi:hypothetical protein
MKNRHPSMHLHIFSQFRKFLEIMYLLILFALQLAVIMKIQAQILPAES